MLAVLKEKDDDRAGLEVLEKLAEKLELRTPAAIRQENRALQEMMLEKQNLGDDNHEQEISFQHLFTVLRRLTSILPPEDTGDDTPELDRVNTAAGVFVPKTSKLQPEIRAGAGLDRRNSLSTDVGGTGAEKVKTQVVPDDFKCPISLDLMKDPVIVATGQVSSSVEFTMYKYFNYLSKWYCLCLCLCLCQPRDLVASFDGSINSS